MSDTPIHDQLLEEYRQRERERVPVIILPPARTDSEALDRFRESMRRMSRVALITSPPPPAPEYFEPRTPDDVHWKRSAVCTKCGGSLEGHP
jgi:hypothetical protein